MPGAARLGDKAQTEADAHGCPGCPHTAIGPIVTGSPDVFINGKPAARLDDLGAHAVCCGPNTFTIARGSPTVYVNGKPLARMQDKTKHCGGSGPITEGSADVLIDDGAASAARLTARAASGAAGGGSQARGGAGAPSQKGASPSGSPAAPGPAAPSGPSPAPAYVCIKVVPPEAPGGCDYYKRRYDNFLTRHKGCGHTPPDYYLGYGKKYCDLFTTSLYPKLSPKGKIWLTRARANLQFAMERGLATTPEIELDNEKFRKFAFGTHADAYWSAGLHDLSYEDKARIALTPELKEWTSGSTWSQAADEAEREAQATADDVARYFGSLF